MRFGPSGAQRSIDLGDGYERVRIQSCNADVSTCMSLCVWPCNRYWKVDDAEPSMMWSDPTPNPKQREKRRR